MSTDRIPTTKTITISSVIDFLSLGIPEEVTTTVVEKTSANGLKSCDKLQVTFSRANAKKIYGSKKDKLEASAEYIGKIEDFIRAVYDSSDASGDDEKDADMTFEDYRNKLAFQRAQVILMGRARTAALKLENTNIDNTLANINTMLVSGKMDVDAIAKLQAMLDAVKKQSEETAEDLEENIA